MDGYGRFTSYGYGATGLVQRSIKFANTSVYTAYAFDPMGNAVSRYGSTDPAMTPQDLAFYDPFGLLTSYTNGNAPSGTPPAPPDPVGYGGQWGNITDVESGLVLMTFRHYDPARCRFLTRDPLGYEGGVNLYAYCRNNPINVFDPLGLWSDYDAWLWARFVSSVKKNVASVKRSVGQSFHTAGHYVKEAMDAKVQFGNPLEMPEANLPMGQEPEEFLPEFELVSPPSTIKVPNPNGSLGKPSTQMLDLNIAQKLQGRGWTITGGGGGLKPQEWIFVPNQGQTGSVRPDITAQKYVNGRLKTLRVNTVLMNKNGSFYNKEVPGSSQLLKLKPNNRNERVIFVSKQTGKMVRFRPK